MVGALASPGGNYECNSVIVIKCNSSQGRRDGRRPRIPRRQRRHLADGIGDHGLLRRLDLGDDRQYGAAGGLRAGAFFVIIYYESRINTVFISLITSSYLEQGGDIVGLACLVELFAIYYYYYIYFLFIHYIILGRRHRRPRVPRRVPRGDVRQGRRARD